MGLVCPRFEMDASVYRTAIQTICGSVMPSLPHQHWYPSHSKLCPQLSQVF